MKLIGSLSWVCPEAVVIPLVQRKGSTLLDEYLLGAMRILHLRGESWVSVGSSNEQTFFLLFNIELITSLVHIFTDNTSSNARRSKGGQEAYRLGL